MSQLNVFKFLSHNQLFFALSEEDDKSTKWLMGHEAPRQSADRDQSQRAETESTSEVSSCKRASSGDTKLSSDQFIKHEYMNAGVTTWRVHPLGA